MKANPTHSLVMMRLMNLSEEHDNRNHQRMQNRDHGCHFEIVSTDGAVLSCPSPIFQPRDLPQFGRHDTPPVTHPTDRMGSRSNKRCATQLAPADRSLGSAIFGLGPAIVLYMFFQAQYSESFFGQILRDAINFMRLKPRCSNKANMMHLG